MYSYQKRKDDTIESLTEAIELEKANLETSAQLYEETGNKIAQSNQQKSAANLENLRKELVDRTSTIENLSDDEIQAWKSLADTSYEQYSKGLEQVGPETKKKIEEAISKIDEKKSEAKTAAEKLSQEVETGFKSKIDGQKWGSDLAFNVSSGMTNQQSKNWVSGAASKVAGWISEQLHHTTPEKGPMKDDDKWMPDFIDNMASGILNNKSKVTNAISQLTQEMTKSMNIPLVQDFGRFQGNINNQIVDSTKTVFTTPQIVFNVQELDEAKLEQCFNYINRKLGSQY